MPDAKKGKTLHETRIGDTRRLQVCAYVLTYIHKHVYIHIYLHADLDRFMYVYIHAYVPKASGYLPITPSSMQAGLVLGNLPACDVAKLRDALLFLAQFQLENLVTELFSDIKHCRNSFPKLLRHKIAQKAHIIWSLGPKALNNSSPWSLRACEGMI